MRGRIDLGPLGSTAYRSVHHKTQSQVTDFRVPVSRWGGMGNGRHGDFVDGNVGVRLPSIPSGPQSLGEDQSGTSQDHSTSTVVAETHLVT